MHISRLIFKLSDVTNHLRRNYQRYPNVTIEKNVRYSHSAPKSAYNKADLLYDKSKLKDKYPVLVNVHGGGFVGGDKKYRVGICSLFASHGWFVFNMNHRLYHKHPAPCGTRDVIDALNFLPSIAEQYKLDLDNIVITGDSAGAYLCAHAISSMHDERIKNAFDLPDCRVNLRAGMFFCGMYDLDRCFRTPAPLGVVRDIAGLILGMKPDKNWEFLKKYQYYNELSPINYINDKWPELYLTMAKKDAFCIGQGEAMEKALQEKGIKHTAYKAYDLGETHCSHLLPYKKSSKLCYESALKFLDSIVTV